MVTILTNQFVIIRIIQLKLNFNVSLNWAQSKKWDFVQPYERSTRASERTNKCVVFTKCALYTFLCGQITEGVCLWVSLISSLRSYRFYVLRYLSIHINNICVAHNGLTESRHFINIWKNSKLQSFICIQARSVMKFCTQIWIISLSKCMLIRYT